MNRYNLLIGVSFIFTITACKQKKEETKESFLPVLSFINNQVSKVDSSIEAIRKIVIVDSTFDTTFVKREAFRELAKDFLETPDISEKKLKKKYTESNFYDQSINKVVITYTPKDEDLELRREEVHIQPDAEKGDKVSTIIMDKFFSNKDSNVQKRLLWQMDDHFQVVTTVQKPGGQERTTTMKVIWNQH